MSFSPELADIRFGCGLSPTMEPTPSPLDLLNGLTGDDLMARRFPVTPYKDVQTRLRRRYALAKAKRKAAGTAREVDIDRQTKEMLHQIRNDNVNDFAQTMLRWTNTRQGFRERLTFFWADHFTTIARSRVMASSISAYVDEAIRPRMTGRFSDLLIAAETHPVMLRYLEQNNSVGPHSRFAVRKGGERGLNENLAREVMELHTLGVGGPYTQDDVRQLAELFTGMSFDRSGEFKFRTAIVEPGSETVLGRAYGGGAASLDDIKSVLTDLAEHPATARHIAGKLAVHFVGDTPDPALVSHVEKRYLDTGGDLMAVYGALVEHPASWAAFPGNVKPPADFVGSAFRALAVAPERLANLRSKKLKNNVLRPMAVMGQPWQKAAGPNGWPEEDASWITPQGLAMRLRWSMTIPRRLRPDLPDPRLFVTQALGDRASPELRFAASAAETQTEAIGLVLASPEFQRR